MGVGMRLRRRRHIHREEGGLADHRDIDIGRYRDFDGGHSERSAEVSEGLRVRASDAGAGEANQQQKQDDAVPRRIAKQFAGAAATGEQEEEERSERSAADCPRPKWRRGISLDEWARSVGLDDKCDLTRRIDLLRAGRTGHVVLRGNGADNLKSVVEAAAAADVEALRSGAALHDVEISERVAGAGRDGEVLHRNGERIGNLGAEGCVAAVRGSEAIYPAGRRLRSQRRRRGIAVCHRNQRTRADDGVAEEKEDRTRRIFAPRWEAAELPA